jgi:hypothetical protein
MPDQRQRSCVNVLFSMRFRCRAKAHGEISGDTFATSLSSIQVLIAVYP